MSIHSLTYPGNTVLPDEETRDTSTLIPLLSSPSPSPSSSPPSPSSLAPILVLGSNVITESTLFMNGLTQNIVILYDLYESLGYRPYLLCSADGAPSEPTGSLASYRTVTAAAMITSGMRVRLFIEIGRSLDPPTRQYLRSIGATLVKLYLGNILNIDVETIHYYPSMFFHHHIVGELDEMWTSPHYLQHLEYAAVLNRTAIERARIVPYVWDPCFLTRYRPSSSFSLEWTPPVDPERQDMVIMDPGISFQKCAFYSLLLAEGYARRHPEWKGILHVINGDRLHLNAHAKNQVLPALTLHQQGRIRYYSRKRIHEVLTEYPSACFLTHQWNNDYNYLTLELMYCMFPVLHNGEGWRDYGYSYDVHRWEEALQTLHLAMTSHKENCIVYRSHAAQLIQRHSIHDPDVRRRWKDILEQTVGKP